MRLPSALKALSIAVLVSGLVGGGIYAYGIFHTAQAAVESVASSGSLADILIPEPLAGESSGQVNILIGGNSTDDVGHPGSELTDSLMVASINISTKKITLISIPRDLWVTYNGSSSKINAVYENGGMAELSSVVQDVTGLTINHTVLVNYAALKTLIDTVGGIDLTINSSDPRGIFDPMIGFEVSNGTQHLNGTRALLLARSRNDPTYDGRIAYGLPNGDFDRQAYQQKIVQAVLTKVMASSTLINPSTIEKLVSDTSGNVQTNLSVGQIRRLYDLATSASSVQAVSIRTDTNGNYLLDNYVSYDGQSALVTSSGDYVQVRQYLMSQLSNIGS